MQGASRSDVDAALCIGRFQPVHHGHVRLLRQGLALAPRCVVVLGGAHLAPTPRAPFTWRERAEMIHHAVPDGERDRVQCVPLRDHHDAARHAAELRTSVLRALAVLGKANPVVVHVCRAEDRVALQGLGRHLVPEREPVDPVALRDACFGAAPDALDAAITGLDATLPPFTQAFLRAWSSTPRFAALAQEWQMLRQYHQAWASAPFPPVFVTVDAVVTCSAHVLLIERAHAPGKGLLAVPGGFIDVHETIEQSALRELREETGIALSDDALRRAWRSTEVFDDPERSQRGRMITHALHFDLGDGALPAVQGGDDAASARWVPIEQLPVLEERLHDDHFQMLDHFLGLLGPRTA